MARSANKGVFLSYSRENERIVSIAARLLRAGGATVFQDVVDIEFGAKWQDALSDAIKRCERVLVFWSAAAATSKWVEREWQAALTAGKRVVPMLLDATPLPAELAALQGMPDLMRLLEAGTREVERSSMNYMRRDSRAPHVVWASLVLALIAGGIYSTVIRRDYPDAYLFINNAMHALFLALLALLVLGLVIVVGVICFPRLGHGWDSAEMREIGSEFSSILFSDPSASRR